MKILDRVRWWRESNRYRATKLNPKDRAALDAELRALRHVGSLECVKSTRHSVRIPDPNRKQGAAEIDGRALTDRGFALVEVKHWAGRIELLDGDLIQVKRKGRQPPVLSHLESKVRHLKRVAVTMVQDSAFEASPLILFTNKNANLTPEVQNLPSVATLDNVEEKLHSALQCIDKLTEDSLENYELLASSFGGYDELRFDGGGIVSGDLSDAVMPNRWSREEFQRISVKISRGWFKTILLGPRLEITLQKWDGTLQKEVLSEPFLKIKHTAPWAAGGLENDGIYAIEHICDIVHGFQYSPFDDEVLKKLSKPKLIQHENKPQDNLASLKSTNTSDNFKKIFLPDSIHNGTIVKKLFDDNGSPYALLVALIERRVTGMLQLKELDDVHPDWIDMMYAVGKPIEVSIHRYSGPRRIQLKIRK